LHIPNPSLLLPQSSKQKMSSEPSEKISAKLRLPILTLKSSIKFTVSSISLFPVLILLEIVRSIRDAEFPYTLEHLDMVNGNDIEVESKIMKY